MKVSAYGAESAAGFTVNVAWPFAQLTDLEYQACSIRVVGTVRVWVLKQGLDFGDGMYVAGSVRAHCPAHRKGF